MTCITPRTIGISAIAAAILAAAGAASAQETERTPFGLLANIFGASERSPPPAAPDRAAPEGQPRLAQGPSADLMVRIDRLEAQIRQLTGAIEQLQFRNQQLEGQLRRVQEEAEYRFQELRGGTPRPPVGQVRSPTTPPVAPPPAGPPARRGDVFDPAQNLNAPGVPRPLGSTIGSVPLAQGPDPEEAPIGAPGGRAAGAPLDLSTLAGGLPDPSLTPPGAVPPTDQLPGPPPRNPSATGAQVATLPPSDSPKDNYDLAYGYIMRKDYALAEEGFRAFLRKFPSDRLAPDAQYWLGESQFQRQRYREAAEAFLNVSTKYESTAKAPDALLRLGQSLAALGEKEAACASLAEVSRKYPRASVGVKQGVDREQKRVRC